MVESVFFVWSHAWWSLLIIKMRLNIIELNFWQSIESAKAWSCLTGLWSHSGANSKNHSMPNLNMNSNENCVSIFYDKRNYALKHCKQLFSIWVCILFFIFIYIFPLTGLYVIAYDFGQLISEISFSLCFELLFFVNLLGCLKTTWFSNFIRRSSDSARYPVSLWMDFI